MRTTRWTFVLLATLLAQVAGAQSMDQWIAWGEAAMRRGDHYGASKFFAGALERSPGRMDLQHAMAEACRLSNQYEKAAENYERVVRKDHRRAHPDAQRWLAEMWMCAGEYRKAESEWTKLLRKSYDMAAYAHIRAQQGLLGCAMARERPNDAVVIEHIPEPINSHDSEFGGRYAPDGSLHFSSLRGKTNEEGEVKDTSTYHVRIFRSALENDVWKAPQALDPVLNTDANNANATWTSDGRFLFTRCDPVGHCHIMQCRFEQGVPTDITRLPGLGDELNATQPMVARFLDREVLFFSSDRPGGSGGRDIWFADLEAAGAERPRIVGAPVNSPGNEVCPYFDSADGTLYFSSDHHAGLGGYDMFSSKWVHDSFDPPVNLGAPLNGPANDLYPMIDQHSGKGLFTSNRKGSLAKKGETCCSDLYAFEFTDHTLRSNDTLIADTAVAVVETELRGLLPIRLYFHNDEPDPRSWATTTGLTYEEAYRSYRSLTPQYIKEQGGNDALIQGIEGFFDEEVEGNYRKLNAYLDVLALRLAAGDSIVMTIRGFASPLARNDYNVNLSLRRIQSLVNHLEHYRGGLLQPYMQAVEGSVGRLTIERSPFGEETAASGVSDQLEDLRNSVYSVGAARERRIEIQAIDLLGAAYDPQTMTLEKDLGDIIQGEEQVIRFSVMNHGMEPLRIESSEADCGCTNAQLPEGPIAPGTEGEIVVLFNGRAAIGPVVKRVIARTDGTPAEIILQFSGNVIEGR